MQYEHAPLDFGFRCSCIGGEVFVAELAGRAFLADFSGYKITQELARAGIGRTLLCTLIKPPRLVNSGLDLPAHFVETQWPHHPDGFVFYKASDVTRPNEGYVLAESFSIEFDETPAVFRFLLGDLQKDLGRSRIVLPNGVRILDEDAVILFFQGNGERQNLLLAEA